MNTPHTQAAALDKTYVCVFQFAVLMWLLTYVGALFNGLTLLILGEVISTCCVSHSPCNTSKHSG